jgi:hypothetical protein
LEDPCLFPFAADPPFLVVREGAEAPDLADLVDDWRAARARIRGTRDRWSL